MCVNVCLHVCTSGLASVDIKGRDPVMLVADPVELVPVAVLGRTVLCENKQLY